MVQEQIPTNRREMFQKLLENVSELDTMRVHFQPPNGMEMEFPAITYSRRRSSDQYADNLPYRSAQGYTVTVIHPDPDNEVKDKIAALPYCAFDRWYATDGLNHDVYTIFF